MVHRAISRLWLMERLKSPALGLSFLQTTLYLVVDLLYIGTEGHKTIRGNLLKFIEFLKML